MTLKELTGRNRITLMSNEEALILINANRVIRVTPKVVKTKKAQGKQKAKVELSAEMRATIERYGLRME